MGEEWTLEKEQDAFEAQLDGLLKSHPGKHILFKRGAVIGFFGSLEEANAAGLERFGLEEDFLVAHIRPRSNLPDAFSWEFGLIRG